MKMYSAAPVGNFWNCLYNTFNLFRICYIHSVNINTNSSVTSFF